ncbi:MAG: relaxase/mobilization nuclease domain-containing protein, partial [Pseudomonadota bacterium]
DDLPGALQEVYAVSKATQCTQYLFSLSLSPPQEHVGSEKEFLEAVDRAEDKLGLTGQPRAVIIHEKEGRRHAHVVWSRIDGDQLKAINLPHFKRKLTDLSKDLYLDHGWKLPDGLTVGGGKSPLNFTLAEWQQAKRQGRDPREIKQLFIEAWLRSDSGRALGTALEERGFFLARGDRRGVVALDTDGQVYSVSRWSGVKAKDIREKVDASELPSVADQQSRIKREISAQLRSYIKEVKDHHRDERRPLLDERRAMAIAHRAERTRLDEGQRLRWEEEARTRTERLNGGLRGLLDRVTGRTAEVRLLNENEAWAAAKRDQEQRDALVRIQMRERKALQEQWRDLHDRQAEDRKALAGDVSGAMRRVSTQEPTGRSPPREADQTRDRKQDRGPDLSL